MKLANFLIALFVLVTHPVIVYAESLENKAAEIEMLDDVTIAKLLPSGDLSDQQQLLTSLAGTWYYELKYWAKEGGEPQISSGTAKNESILGGKYLISKSSLILNIGGQNIPYESWEMLGYDVNKKAFTSVRADSMHDGFVTGSGLYNERLNAIQEKGIFKSPLDAKERSYRSVLYFTNEGAYKKEYFIIKELKREFKAVEINFERR